MCFVAPQSGGKLQTHLSLYAKMQRSANGFLHDKLTESNVFPRPHPFTPAPPGKITKQGEKQRKEGLEERLKDRGEKNDTQQEFTMKPCTSIGHFR